MATDSEKQIADKSKKQYEDAQKNKKKEVIDTGVNIKTGQVADVRQESQLASSKKAYGGGGGGSSSSNQPTQESQLTQQQQIQKSLLERQGKTVEVTPQGELKATSGNTQSVISKYGDVVTAPTSATIQNQLVYGNVQRPDINKPSSNEYEQKAELPYGAAQRQTVSELKQAQDLNRQKQLEGRYGGQNQKYVVGALSYRNPNIVNSVNYLSESTSNGKIYSYINSRLFPSKTLAQQEKEYREYEEKVRSLSKSEREFVKPIFQDIESFSSKVTLGYGKPIEQRSYIGQTAQNVVSGVLSVPFVAARSALYAAPKAFAAVEGYYKYPELRPYIKEETTSAAPKRLVQGFNPKTPEGTANIILTVTPFVVKGFRTPSVRAAVSDVAGMVKSDLVSRRTFAEGIKAKDFFSKVIESEKVTPYEPVSVFSRVNAQRRGASIGTLAKDYEPVYKNPSYEVGDFTNPEYFKQFAKEQKLAATERAKAQLIQEIRGGQVTNVIPRSDVRKALRKDIVAKNSINPLDIPKVVDYKLPQIVTEASADKIKVYNVYTGEILFEAKKGKPSKSLAQQQPTVKVSEPEKTSEVKSSTGQSQLVVLEEPKVEAKQRSMTMQEFKQKQLQQQRLILKQEVKPVTILKQTQKQRLSSILLPVQKQKQEEVAVQKQTPINILKPTVKPALGVRSVAIQKPAQEQKSVTALRPVQDVKSVSVIKPAQAQKPALRVSQEYKRDSDLVMDLQQKYKRFKVPEFDKEEFSSLAPSYDVFLKRGKDFVKIGSGLTKGRALKLGSEETLRNLRATFKVKESGVTAQRDIDYAPSLKFFREYKIVKGQRVDTPFTFIQRAETRLSSLGEKSEIQMFKKLRGRF